MIRRASVRAAIVVGFGCLSLTGGGGSHHVASAPAHAACQEDEACWDWRTMGNRCGRDSLSEPVRCAGEQPELERTGMWWPCWAFDVPCDVEG